VAISIQKIKKGETPLHSSASYIIFKNSVVLEEVAKITGVDINIQCDLKKETVLHKLLHDWTLGKTIQPLKNLLNLGFDCNIQDYLGRTPLMIACERDDNYFAVKTIIESSKYIDINIQDFEGRTALHYLAFNYKSTITDISLTNSISIILQHGADATIRDKSNIAVTDIIPLPIINLFLTNDFDQNDTKLYNEYYYAFQDPNNKTNISELPNEPSLKNTAMQLFKNRNLYDPSTRYPNMDFFMNLNRYFTRDYDTNVDEWEEEPYSTEQL